MKGYKIFNPEMKCRDFQYEIGKEYKHDGDFKICNSGFHFCIDPCHCFSYYEFNPKNIVCEVEAIGETQTHSDDSKIATNHIKILRQLTWDEVLKISNKGENNLGYSNAGNSNAGNYNAGNYNAGYSNAGNDNAGNRNAGYSNAGNRNAGYSNAGNDNAGNYNAGNRNAGYSNAGNDNAGAFNISTKYKMFDKDSDWTYDDFIKSKAFKLLHSIDTTLWIPSSLMTDKEKSDYPYHVTIGGYCRVIDYKEAFVNKWNNWSESNKQAFTSLPNFDWEIFTKITGVKP